MNRLRRIIIPVIVFVLCFWLGYATAQDSRVADLVKAGEIKWGIFTSQRTATKNANGSMNLTGVRPEIASLFASYAGVKRLIFVDRPGPVETIECLKASKCDAAFIHLDDRARGVLDFSNPLIYYEFTLIVPNASKITKVTDAYKSDVRVVGIRGHASARVFGRVSKQKLIIVETPKDAADLMLSGKADAIASTRHSLHGMAAHLPDARILDDHYGENINRIAIPPGNAARLAYINEFVEEIKKSGQLQKIVDRDNTGAGFQVSGPGDTR